MLPDALWQLLQEKVFSVPSTPTLFNPYRDHDDAYDRPGAVALRRANLRSYLDCYARRPPLLLVAEAPGPWGCRFSGVPLVSEAQLADPAFPIDGVPTSRAEPPHGEYSANIYWRVLRPYFPHFFTWNTVPLHPHRAEAPLTIRTPRVGEVKAFTGLLGALLEVLRPARVLAIGRKAETALGHLGAACTYVRHPSQGGARRFEAGVLDAVRAMGLPASTD